jgi:hypothetical protein
MLYQALTKIAPPAGKVLVKSTRCSSLGSKFIGGPMLNAGCCELNFGFLWWPAARIFARFVPFCGYEFLSVYRG